MYLQAGLTSTLHRIPWFVDLAQSQLECLASIATLFEMEAGDILFKEGDREDYLYILLEGQLVLEMEVPTRGQVPFYTAETWDIIGWSSLTPIARQRTASVRATKPCVLIGLNSKLLQQTCEEDHELGFVVMSRLANVVANRLLTTRLCLLEIITQTVQQSDHLLS